MRLLVALLLILSIVSCKRDVKRDPSIMYVHIINDPEQMHPINTSSEVQQYISTLTQKCLYQVDLRTFDLMPAVITQMPEIVDDSITYRFNLRQDVKWDDGSPLTSEDVAFTIKMVMCPLTNNPGFRPVYRSVIDSVVTYNDDPYKFDVIMKERNLSNPYIFTEMYLQQRKYWDPDQVMDAVSFKSLFADEFKTTKKVEKWFEGFNDEKNGYEPKRIKGLGAYRITEWDRKNQIVVEKKKNWWGENDTSAYNQAYTDKIIFRIIESDEAASLAFKRGELDVSQKIGTEALLNLRETKKFKQDYYSAFVDQLGYTYIGLNLRPDGVVHKPIFSDKQVRWAMSHGIDVEAIIDVFLHGQGERQVANVSPTKPYYNKDIEPVAYDPEKAAQILDEAGWVDSDGDNVREKVVDGETVRLSFKLNYFAENAAFKDMAMMVKDDLEKVGFEVIPNELLYGQLVNDALAHNFDAMFGSWIGDAGLTNPTQLWSTESWANKGYNFTGFGDAVTDSLIQSVNLQTDMAGYTEAIKRFQEKIYEEQPYIFLYQLKKKVIISKRFKNANMYAEKPGIILGNLEPANND